MITGSIFVPEGSVRTVRSCLEKTTRLLLVKVGDSEIRHRIRCISSQGKKLFANSNAAVDFVPAFHDFVNSRNLSLATF